MTESVHPVVATVGQLRGAMLKQEQDTASRLVSVYGRLYGRLGDQIATIEQQLTTSGQLTRVQADNLASIRALRGQIIDEVNRYAIYADQEITQAAFRSISASIADSQTLVQAYLISPEAQAAVSAAYRTLPTEAVIQMIGYLQEDSPLRLSFRQGMGEALAERVSDALVDGIAAGMNPRTTAALIRREMGQGLTWSLRTARTVQLYSYRQAATASYMANSDIVTGWKWWAQFDDRVCMSCIAKHGSVHRVDEILNDHHNGRCVQIPIVRLPGGAGDVPDTTGEEWFNTLPPGEQIQRMGPAMYSAWRAGEFSFGDLSTPYQDPVYGEMLREASLRGLLGGRAREYYQ